MKNLLVPDVHMTGTVVPVVHTALHTCMTDQLPVELKLETKCRSSSMHTTRISVYTTGVNI